MLMPLMRSSRFGYRVIELLSCGVCDYSAPLLADSSPWNREAADDLRGTVIRIAGKDARPLAPGEFYLYQLVGLDVFNEAGEKLGVVVDIMEAGANDVFVIQPDDDGKEFLLPNIPDIIPVIDPAARRMVARPLVFYGE